MPIRTTDDERSPHMKRACDFAVESSVPMAKTMRMTRMKRVLEGIEEQGHSKRFRQAVSEIGETKRILRFHVEENAVLKGVVAQQSKTIAYQDRRMREANATLLVGKRTIERLVERVHELESVQTYSAVLFEKSYFVE